MTLSFQFDWRIGDDDDSFPLEWIDFFCGVGLAGAGEVGKRKMMMARKRMVAVRMMIVVLLWLFVCS